VEFPWLKTIVDWDMYSSNTLNALLHFYGNNSYMNTHYLCITYLAN